MNGPLHGLRVLVTRPAAQARCLSDKLRAAGARVLLLPVIGIEALGKDVELSRLSSAEMDIAIFVSSNAVHYAVPVLAANDVLATVPVAAVGKATAHALREYGLRVDLYPQRQFNSEGLLALPDLQENAVRDRQVVIFRGQGGRETLAKILRKRGAKVRYMEVYRRVQPEFNPPEHTWFALGAVDVITVSSNEALLNLFAMLGEAPWLRNKVFIGISPRLAEQAGSLGIKHFIAAEEACDDGILDALLKNRQLAGCGK